MGALALLQLLLRSRLAAAAPMSGHSCCPLQSHHLAGAPSRVHPAAALQVVQAPSLQEAEASYAIGGDGINDYKD